MRKHSLIPLLLLCIIGFIIPFFTKSQNESFNSTLSTSFTILSTLVTIIALIIAIILFDKYGVNARFKERQLETVLVLVNEFKFLNISVSTANSTYINYIRKSLNLEKLPKDTYDVDKLKVLLLPKNFCELIKPISDYRANPWVPSEIKDKMKFLDVIATKEIDDFDSSKYVKLNINGISGEPWLMTVPKFTFEMYSLNLNTLLITIINWINKQSNIKVDFDLIDD